MVTNAESKTLKAARSYLAAGLSMIPISLNGRKQPHMTLLPRAEEQDGNGRYPATWKPFQERLPTGREIATWFSNGEAAIAVVCGAASGGVECLDLDAVDLVDDFAEALKNQMPDLAAKLVWVDTPSGGLHLWYRCAEVCGNTVLARKGKETLIETRGEGGYAIVPGSPLAAHPAGKPYEFRTIDLSMIGGITADEREYLWRLAESYDLSPQDGTTLLVQGVDDLSPAEDFDRRGPSFQELLAGTGCKLERGTWDDGKLTRPGKDHGYGATVGHCSSKRNGVPLLRVFTSGWPEFPPGSYGKFRVYATLQHGGNYKAAMVELRRKGFGGKASLNGKSHSEMPPADEPVVVESKVTDISHVAKIADLRRFGAQIRWIWQDWIQMGVLTAIAAPGGMGKTRFCADLVRRMVHNQPWPDGQEMQVAGDIRVLWVVADNHHDEMVTLTENFGIEEVVYLNASPADPYGGVTLETPEDIRDLEARIKVVKPHLVIIDTVGNSTDKNLSKQEDAKAYYQPLQLVARRQRTAILCLTHLNAGGTFLGRRVLEKVRSALRMDKPDPNDDRRALEIFKSNSKKPDTLGVKMTDKGNDYDKNPPKAPEETGFGGSVTPRSPARFDECKEWLRKMLQDGPKTIVDIRDKGEELGFSVNTIYKAKSALLIEEGKVGFRKVWKLPEINPDADECDN